jgi:hypothetical protein
MSWPEKAAALLQAAARAFAESRGSSKPPASQDTTLALTPSPTTFSPALWLDGRT